MTLPEIMKAITRAHERADLSTYLSLHVLYGEVEERIRQRRASSLPPPAPVAGILSVAGPAVYGVVDTR